MYKRQKPLFLAGVLLTVLFVFPVLVLDMYKKMYEQKRFGDACAYMEQLLYAFQKTGKIVSALKEVRGIFGEGQIRLCVEEAIAHMEYGHPVGEQGVLREGLQTVSYTHLILTAEMWHPQYITDCLHCSTADRRAAVLQSARRTVRKGK